MFPEGAVVSVTIVTMAIASWLADAPLTAEPPPAWLSKLFSCVEAVTRRANITERLLLRSKSSPTPEGAIRLATLSLYSKGACVHVSITIYTM